MLLCHLFCHLYSYSGSAPLFSSSDRILSLYRCEMTFRTRDAARMRLMSLPTAYQVIPSHDSSTLTIWMCISIVMRQNINNLFFVLVGIILYPDQLFLCWIDTSCFLFTYSQSAESAVLSYRRRLASQRLSWHIAPPMFGRLNITVECCQCVTNDKTPSPFIIILLDDKWSLCLHLCSLNALMLNYTAALLYRPYNLSADASGDVKYLKNLRVI